MKGLRRYARGGGKTLLILVAVLGLISLIGCSNTSGGNASRRNGKNAFLGRWSGTVVTAPMVWEFRSDGTCTLMATGNGVISDPSSYPKYEYTVSGNTATIHTATGSVPITLGSDGKSFLYIGSRFTKEN